MAKISREEERKKNSKKKEKGNVCIGHLGGICCLFVFLSCCYCLFWVNRIKKCIASSAILRFECTVVTHLERLGVPHLTYRAKGCSGCYW